MSRDKNTLVDIWLLSLLAERLVDELTKDSPLGVEEFAVYGLIVDLAPVTAADLVRGTGLSPTTLSGILARCEQRGELRRVPNPADRRSSLLELTDAGQVVYLEAVPALMTALSAIDERLGPAVRRVREALEDLDGALRDVLGVGARPYTLESGDTTMLTSEQRIELDRYAEWLIHRDTRRL